jgi:hypothetical protein
LHSWGNSFEANVRPLKEWSQLPKIGAVKNGYPRRHRGQF